MRAIQRYHLEIHTTSTKIEGPSKQSQWESVLPDALHSIRSLLCTATNETPHERLFRFPRRNSAGNTLPSWLLEQGKVLLRRHVRNSKYDDLCDEVDLIETNPTYARVRLANGYEKTVSLRDLAQLPKSDIISSENSISAEPINTPIISESPVIHPVIPPSATSDIPQSTTTPEPQALQQPSTQPSGPMPVRQSQRLSSAPERLNYDKFGGR